LDANSTRKILRQLNMQNVCTVEAVSAMKIWPELLDTTNLKSFAGIGFAENGFQKNV